MKGEQHVLNTSLLFFRKFGHELCLCDKFSSQLLTVFIRSPQLSLLSPSPRQSECLESSSGEPDEQLLRRDESAQAPTDWRDGAMDDAVLEKAVAQHSATTHKDHHDTSTSLLQSFPLTVVRHSRQFASGLHVFVYLRCKPLSPSLDRVNCDLLFIQTATGWDFLGAHWLSIFGTGIQCLGSSPTCSTGN